MRISDVARVGDYVMYSSDVTYFSTSVGEAGTNGRQSFEPAKTKTWRVLTNCDGYVEVVGVNELHKLFLQGENGYRNVVAVLNQICTAYVNRRHAVSARSLGTNEESISKANEILTFENVFNTRYRWKTNATLDDENHLSDAKIVLDNSFFSKGSGWIWLGSRSVDLKDDRCGFAVKAITPEGKVEDIPLCMDYSDGRHYNMFECCHVCPVIRLRNDITVVSGDGSRDNPYVLA